MKKKTLDVGVEVYLNDLLESRLLIQASSGGGKSYMLRVLAEQALPHMPVLILDWEGEFASLRERFDMVLAGSGGDVPCDVKSAAMLARSLVDLQVSALIDLSELKSHLRLDYVRDFLTALIELPRKSWPSTKGKAFLVMVDEAHKLCPQSSRSVAGPAVIDLQSRGRKRGFVGVLATQRLSKLDKDAAAECGTVFVGRCSSIDSARACDILGLPKKESHGLTQLRAGEWRAVGAALEPGLQKFRGAKAKTTHAKSGAKLLAPPAPSKKIRRILPSLQAIQDQTVEELRTVEQYKKELANIRRELTNERKGKSKPEIRTVDRVVGDPAAVEKAVRLRDRIWERWIKTEIHPILRRFYGMVDHIIQKKPAEHIYPQSPELPAIEKSAPIDSSPPKSIPTPSATFAKRSKVDRLLTEPNGELTAPQQRVLDSVAWWGRVGVPRPAKACVAIIARYSASSGGFNNLLGQLRAGGYIDYPSGGHIELTGEGHAAISSADGFGTLKDLHNAWREMLSAPQLKLLEVIIRYYPDTLTKEDLAVETQYSPTSGGFNNLLGRLRKFGLITKSGEIKGTTLLFPEALLR
jgi:hypothetical protein